MQKWKLPKDWVIIWIDSDRSHLSSDKISVVDLENILIIDEFDLVEYKYIDILSSVDVAVIKTGFGVVSEVGFLFFIIYFFFIFY